jgi:DNA repair protein RecO (recombination protein O)
VRDSEPHPSLLALLVDYLGRLDGGPARPAALRAYELGALQAAGLMPCVSGCARCGAALGAGTGGRLAFDPAVGGALCSACEGAASPAAPRLALSTVQALARLQARPGAAEGSLCRPAPGPARLALSCFIEHYLGARPPAAGSS